MEGEPRYDVDGLRPGLELLSQVLAIQRRVRCWQAVVNLIVFVCMWSG